MPNIGELVALLRADISDLDKKLDKAERHTEKTTKKMGKSLGSIPWKAMAMVAAAAFAATSLAMLKTLKVASDLQEVTSKFNTVFAGQQKKAEEFVEVLQSGYATSEREAKQFLSAMQDLLVPMGVAKVAAADLSFEIVKLSADLGSFNNMPTERVMLDVQSALVGNFETMKKYGIVLNAASVEQQIFSMGLAKTKDEITAGDKAVAAYKLIVEGSTFAIGDMARTQMDYANQVKQAKANIEDIVGVIGMQLLPIVTDLIVEFNKMAKEILENDDALELIIGTAEIAAKTFVALGKAVMAVPTYFGKLLDAFGDVALMMEIETNAVDKYAMSLRDLHKLLGGAVASEAVAGDITSQLDANYEITKEDKARYLELELTHQNYLAQFRENQIEQFAALADKQAQAEIDATKYSQEQKYQFYADAAGRISGTFLQIAQAGGKQSKKAFLMYQAFAIVQAYMSAASAYVKTLAEPALPWPGNVVMANIIAGMAAVQIAMIASAKPPSYDLGGVSTSPGIYYSGVPEAHVPLHGGGIPVKFSGDMKSSPDVNINLVNPVFQDLETQRRVIAQMIEIGVNKMAPGAVIRSYKDDHPIRDMIRGRA